MFHMKTQQTSMFLKLFHTTINIAELRDESQYTPYIEQFECIL